MPDFNRRDAARAAMLGSASLLLSPAVNLQTQSLAAQSGLLDAHAFGAVGDSKTDNTAALQKALDAAASLSGGVFLPPGTYLTHELHVRPGTALIGIPAWNYSHGGGSVLKLAGTDSTCLLNLTEARGATIDGLALDGGFLGSGIHGIWTDRTKWGEHEDGFRIERCQVARFTGDGMRLDCVWCFSVRHCELAYNHGDGMNMRGWDAFILDNWFSGNQGAGFAARRENASVTFIGNRIEWNSKENFVIVGGDGYQINNNFFDRAGTIGIAIHKSNWGPAQINITGNLIKRSGKNADPNSHDSAQVLFENAKGVNFTGNTIWAGRDDGNKGLWSPSFGIIYQGLENSILRNNTMHEAALKQLLLDLGSHGDGVIVSDNPGKLLVPR
jgi:hypothetical protein